ncbi:DUF6436 domain-containing protein [Paraglaciecola sp.]|uniref:DUF6436 domain-containing protein n=1 Tax=Paraglaciecola sp. TaxID=1920173 RepID=UPI003EF73959
MSYIFTQQLVDFDPDLKLSAAISDIKFEQKLVQAIGQSHQLPNKTVVHFINEDCFCQIVSSSHINNLSSQLNDEGFQNIYIDLQKNPILREIIPSSPSIAIIGAQQELIYLGPYAEGYGCLTGTSLVDNIIQKVFSKKIENSVLITEAQGCYCNI